MYTSAPLSRSFNRLLNKILEYWNISWLVGRVHTENWNNPKCRYDFYCVMYSEHVVMMIPPLPWPGEDDLTRAHDRYTQLQTLSGIKIHFIFTPRFARKYIYSSFIIDQYPRVCIYIYNFFL